MCYLKTSNLYPRHFTRFSSKQILRISSYTIHCLTDDHSKRKDDINIILYMRKYQEVSKAIDVWTSLGKSQ